MRIPVCCLAVLLFLSMSVNGIDILRCLDASNTPAVITNNNSTKSCYLSVNFNEKCQTSEINILPIEHDIPAEAEKVEKGVYGSKNEHKCEFYSDIPVFFDGSLTQIKKLVAGCALLKSNNNTFEMNEDCQNSITSTAAEFFAEGKPLYADSINEAYRSLVRDFNSRHNVSGVQCISLFGSDERRIVTGNNGCALTYKFDPVCRYWIHYYPSNVEHAAEIGQISVRYEYNEQAPQQLNYQCHFYSNKSMELDGFQKQFEGIINKCIDILKDNPPAPHGCVHTSAPEFFGDDRKYAAAAVKDVYLLYAGVKENIRCLNMYPDIPEISDSINTKCCYYQIVLDGNRKFSWFHTYQDRIGIPKEAEPVEVDTYNGMYTVLYYDITKDQTLCKFYTEKSLAFDASPEEFEVLLPKCMELVEKNGTKLPDDFQKKAIEWANEQWFAEGKKFEQAKIKALIPPRTTTELTTEPSTPTTILTTELTAKPTVTTKIPSTKLTVKPSTSKMIPAKNSHGAKVVKIGPGPDMKENRNLRCLDISLSPRVTDETATLSCYYKIAINGYCEFDQLQASHLTIGIPKKAKPVNVGTYNGMYTDFSFNTKDKAILCEFYSNKSLAFDGSSAQFTVLFDKCIELLKKNGRDVSDKCQYKAVVSANKLYFGEGKKFDSAKIKALLSTVPTPKLTAETSTPTTILEENSSGANSMLVGLLLVFISI